jgi:hypothetical protein
LKEAKLEKIKRRILFSVLIAICLMESFLLVKNVYERKQSAESAKVASKQIPDEPVPVSDGPYVFWMDNRVVVQYVCDDQKLSQQYEVQDSMEIADSCEESSDTYSISALPPTPESDNYSGVSKIIAIGDIHGSFDSFINLLLEFEIIDGDLNWNWGDGHLVITGDILDRGPGVNEALWFVHQLEKEARQDGGYVHFLLGNHEVMVLRGDNRYVHEKYTRVVSRKLKIKISDLYGPETELGRWLRTKNVIEKINDIIFVHAGISPELMQRDYTIRMVNDQIRNSLDVRDYSIQLDEELLFFYGYKGPFWYRGYIKEWQEIPMADKDQVISILDFYGASTIVVGHSIMDQITSFYGGLVYAIDTGIYKGSKGEALLWENDSFFRLNISSGKELLN